MYFKLLCRYWLFGEKVQDLPEGEESLLRVRGWFPRRCAVEIVDNFENGESSVNDKKIK